MNTSANTLYALLQDRNAISVPNYQRAYSWTTKNVEVLLNDLDELGDRKYYYGHFQFEDQQNETFLVLDGQQRLTTLFLMYSAYNHLGGKEYRHLFNNQENKLKFKTVGYDQDYFNEIENKHVNEIKTQSQLRLNEAYDMLKELPVDKLEYYLQQLLNATVTTDTVLNKYEAVQRFALQNDRGVRATELDIVKADLMLYVYKHERDTIKAEDITERIQLCFAKIYENIENIDIIHSEVQMLKYVACAYYNINMDRDIVVELRSLVNKKENYQSEGPGFVLELVEKLELGFRLLHRIQELSKEVNCMVGDALLIEFKQAIILLLLTIERLVPDDSSDYSEINKILKHFVFIYYRINAYGGNSSADRLFQVAKEFLGNENKTEALSVLDYELKKYAQNSYTGWQRRWDNLFGKFILDRIGELNHYDYHKYKKNATYILWKYKNKEKEAIMKDKDSYYKTFTNKSSSEAVTIDHDLPRNPDKEYKNEEIYKYMNSFGNLDLISRSDNSSKGNSTPDDEDKKLEEIKTKNERIVSFIKETMFYEGELNYVTDWLSKNKA